MEITSFVLGMLTIVAAGISASIVVGLAKINKLTRKTESLTQLCAAIEGDLRREIDSLNNAVWHEFEKTGRDITMVEKTLMNQIDETKRYIDSRIDKIRGEQGSKQILKG